MALRIEDIRRGDKVLDSWWMYWGAGTVIKVLKTRVHVRWWKDEEPIIYDKQHAEQFLIITKDSFIMRRG